METTQIEKKTSYINFKIGKEYFAISVYRVLEIIQLNKLTEIPNSSEFVLGVLNFRGSIVPVIDMHKRFNVKSASEKDKMVIVVDIKNNKENTVLMGLVVDEVTEVVQFDYKSIRAVPELGIKYNPDFLEGIVEINEKFILVLNVDRVLSIAELSELTEITKKHDSKK
jgi:purine-binding chemotaxis protein CheW